MDFESIGLHVPKILLPKNVSMEKWAVIACDQFTSNRKYWQDVESFVGDNPSTLRIVLPEIYLDRADSFIGDIYKSMKDYTEKYLTELSPGFILVERKFKTGLTRKGLLVALDLEMYDFSRNSRSLIRPTEATISERLPPRVKIRKNALIEVPHIMVLIDDAEKGIIEKVKLGEKLYDFELMMGGGHITGYSVGDEKTISEIAKKLESLKKKSALLYAVGDGNHSLAAAKAMWQELKSTAPINHPARYAMVELVNLHNPGLRFEPIHRVLFNVNEKDVLDEMGKYYGSSFSFRMTSSLEAAKNIMDDNSHNIPFICRNSFGIATIKNPPSQIVVGTLQPFVDHLAKKGVKVDYVHDEDEVTRLGKNNFGFYLPPFPKQSLFKSVINDGILPKKAFSIGVPEEKRYYLECRRIG